MLSGPRSRKAGAEPPARAVALDREQQRLTPRIRGASLFRKYALVIVVLVSGALLVSGVVQLYFSYLETRSALVALQREKATEAAVRIEAFLGEIERQVAASAPNPDLPESVSSAEREDDLKRLLRLVPAITDLSYLDASGHERYRLSRIALNVPNNAADFSRDPRFEQARDGRTFYGPVYFRNESEPYLSLSVGETGPLGGMTTAEVNLKFIWDVVSGIRIGQTGYAYVVDQRGQLVAHPDLNLVLRRADLSGLPQVSAVLAGERPSDDRAFGTTLAGDAVLAAHAVVYPPGWSVVVEQPLQEAFSPLYASVFRTVLLLLAGLGLAALASLLLSHRMVAPIRALEEGAIRVGAGALEQRIDVRTGDELEVLAEAFNAMSAQLHASYAGLEQKIEARTRDLAQAMSELEAANRHKSAFLATMSHELRTPLNAIIGFSDLLLERLVGDLNERQARYAGNISASGRHLLSLINDILDLSKVEAGRMELQLGQFALAEVLEHALLIVRERAIRHRITLSMDVDPVIGAIVADERKIKQVLFNLLSNAVKFTADGGQVQVTARAVADDVHVLVHDTGVGIAIEDQARVFDSFVQVGHNEDRAREGTGLGLALARSFVELHGGRIWVHSQPGVGSTFGFCVPRRSTIKPEANGSDSVMAHVG